MSPNLPPHQQLASERSTRINSPPATDGRPVMVLEPYHRGLPPLASYLRQLWQRRRFAFHMARSELKARHFDSLFGQVWTVLNPLLLASVYYLLLGVILQSDRGSPDYLAFLIANLFAFYYTRNSLGVGAGSVVSGGGLIMNTAFPRALLPLSSVFSALLMYLPTLLVYAVIHVAAGQPVTLALAFVPLIVAIQTVFNYGLALLAAAVTVYFRDFSSFLPYALRIWLYVSPVLYRIDDVPSRLAPILMANPLYPILAAWQDILIHGNVPALSLIAGALTWATVLLLLGGWLFLSREREFATRI